MCPDYRLQSHLQPAAMLAGWYNKLTAVMLACCGCWCVCVCVCVCGTLEKSKINQAGLRLPQLANLILMQFTHSSCFPFHSIFPSNPHSSPPFCFSYTHYHIFWFHPEFKLLDQSPQKQYIHEFGFFLESFSVTTLLFSYTHHRHRFSCQP